MPSHTGGDPKRGMELLIEGLLLPVLEAIFTTSDLLEGDTDMLEALLYSFPPPTITFDDESSDDNLLAGSKSFAQPGIVDFIR